MSTVLSFLPPDGWQRLLCDALWQSTLIGGFGWLIARFLVRQSAARAWLMLLTITGCLVVPLASLAARQNGWTLMAANSQVDDSEDKTDGKVSVAESPVQVQGLQPLGLQHEGDSPEFALKPPEFVGSDFPNTVSPSPITPLENYSRPPAAPIATGLPLPSRTGRGEGTLLFNVLRLAWLFASAILLARLALSFATTRRLLRLAKPCDDAQLLTAAANAAQRLGLSLPVQLLVGDKISTPMVLALGRPRLLVPVMPLAYTRSSEMQSAAHSDSEPRPLGSGSSGPQINWTAAFTHELAQVVRRDGWSRLWVEFIAIVMPLAPLVWLLRRSFRIACEEACDDWVIATGTEPADYVGALTTWINRPCRVTPLPAIGMSITKWRLLRLLSLRETPIVEPSRFKRGMCAALALVLIAGLAVAQTKSSQPENTVPPTKSIQQKIEDKPAANPPGEVGQNAIANDPLLPLYEKRMAENQEYLELEKVELADIKSGKPVSNGATEESLRNDIQRFEEAIKSYKERIEKRKAELKSRISDDVKEKQATKSPLPPYVIEPPDVILIDAISLVPKKPFRLAPGDKVKLAVEGTRLDSPISGTFQLDSAGEIVLGPAYGAVKIAGLTRVEAQEAVTEQLKETLVNPQVALVIDEARLTSGITGQHLVGPDGMVNLGIYGSAYVAGCTIPEASRAIEKQLVGFFREPKVSVDIYAYNSKVYYVINKGERGDNIQRFPITGNETILDAISQTRGVSDLASKIIWIARPKPNGEDQFLRFRWDQITAGDDSTNYQVLPGDRIFIESKARGTNAMQRDVPRADVKAPEPELSGTKRTDESAKTPPTFAEPYSRPGR